MMIDRRAIAKNCGTIPLALVRRRKYRDCSTVRIAQICRPTMPIARTSRCLHGMQRSNCRVLCQQFAAIGAEAGKVQMEFAVGAGASMNGFPNSARSSRCLARAAAGQSISDNASSRFVERLAQPFRPQRVGHMRLAEHLSRRSMQQVQEQTCGRRVRTEARGSAPNSACKGLSAKASAPRDPTASASAAMPAASPIPPSPPVTR